MRGFQLWINLPASHKMSVPEYQEFIAEDIPEETTEAGGLIRVITGGTDRGTKGAVLLGVYRSQLELINLVNCGGELN